MEPIVLGNRYELHEEIGSGGMAHVFRARDQLLDRIVAIKILKPEYTEDTQFIDRFRIEAQAAARLSDPNIVMVYDVGQDEGIYYIIMEHVDGITLKDYISSVGTINWKEAVTLGIQITQAIDSAHMNHIIHRDIKPHNILITRDKKIKVTDFGIARAATNSTITTVGNAMGSVHYFSPEQAKGALTDEKSDIYSLGITLYEMVTGDVPFDGDTPIAIALKQIQENPIAPSMRNSQVPEGLSAIILKAIEKDKFDRYQTTGAMLSDLKKILKDPYSENLRALAPLAPGERDRYSDRHVSQEHRDEEDDDEYDDDAAELMHSNQVKRIRTVPSRNGQTDGGGRRREDQRNDHASRKAPPTRNGSGRSRNGRNNRDVGAGSGSGNGSGGGGRNKALVLLPVLVVLIAIGFMLWIMSTLFGSIAPTGGRNGIEDFSVDSYIGQKYSDVSVLLNNQQVKATEKKVFSSIDKGVIISQSVEKGKKLKLDGTATIEFEVSDGIERIEIIDFRNTEYRAAEAKLKSLGLITEVLDEYSDEVMGGYVVRTEPGAKEEVEIGSRIIIFRSAGAIDGGSRPIVPQLVGKTYTEAKRLIEQNGFSVGNLEPSEAAGSAMVIRQSLPPNSFADEGTAIDLWFEEGGTTTLPESSTTEATTTEESTTTSETTSESTTESTSTEGTTTLPNDQPTTDATATTEPGGTETVAAVRQLPRSVELKLLPDVEYGENIRLMVEVTPSDTGVMKRIVNRRVSKADFPYQIDYMMPENGSVLMKVYYNNELIQAKEIPDQG